MAAWNAAFIIAGLLLIALVGEAYFRLTKPFIDTSIPSMFVDGVGIIREPNAEVRYANWHDDNFGVSRANSQGFLDREPVNPELAAASCHIAFIGDSYVEAVEAPIADKFQVRLEEMTARELPHLDITTQAYGITNTGQINQLPFYDEYARHLNPKLVVLVFFVNDFANNITAAQALNYGADPDRMPYMSAHRDANGTLKLRPPDPEYERFLLPRWPDHRWHNNAWRRLVGVSHLAKWLNIKKIRWLVYNDRARYYRAWAKIIAARPCCEWLRRAQIAKPAAIWSAFKEERLPPSLEKALQYTAFGIEQFKRRADRDGAALAILSATRDMGTRGDPQFDRISAIAEARGIPIISDYEYIVRQGYDAQDGTWASDGHWNAVGHQWAAEAVLEWLKENQEVCD